MYDDDPAINPHAKKYDSMTYQEILDKQLKVIDLSAAILLMERKIPSKLFALKEEGGIIRVFQGASVGTTIE